MTTLCHQCQVAVPTGAAYCPECGAPQLRVRPAAAPEPEVEAAPQQSGEIAWPAAVRSTMLFALPAGVLVALCEGQGLLQMLWIVGGTVLALRRYRKLAPLSPRLTAKLSGRIGLLLGLFATAVNLLAEAGGLVVERYALHGGAAIDARMHSYAQLEIDMMKATEPDMMARLGWLTRFWLSPEGAGTLLLSSLAASAVFALFFGWLTGRFSVRWSGGLRRRTL